jgi:hypothetical protein
LGTREVKSDPITFPHQPVGTNRIQAPIWLDYKRIPTQPRFDHLMACLGQHFRHFGGCARSPSSTGRICSDRATLKLVQAARRIDHVPIRQVDRHEHIRALTRRKTGLDRTRRKSIQFGRPQKFTTATFLINLAETYRILAFFPEFTRVAYDSILLYFFKPVKVSVPKIVVGCEACDNAKRSDALKGEYATSTILA